MPTLNEILPPRCQVTFQTPRLNRFPGRGPSAQQKCFSHDYCFPEENSHHYMFLHRNPANCSSLCSASHPHLDKQTILPPDSELQPNKISSCPHKSQNFRSLRLPTFKDLFSHGHRGAENCAKLRQFAHIL